MTRERHGFTLIELLVVIAIIAILAAILFPVFAKARAKARQTACMSNLKQLGLGFEMYAQDFDEFLPIWGYGDTSEPENGPAQGFFSWDTVIQPYLKNQAILLCPDNPYERNARGYAMARYTGDAYGVDMPLHKDRPPLPSETVLLGEKGHLPPGINGDSAMEHFMQSNGAAISGQDWRTEEDEWGRMFHDGGKNFLFLDGHVKWHSRGSGPFAYNSGLACSPAGYTGHDLYDSPHCAGHCELWTDWPHE